MGDWSRQIPFQVDIAGIIEIMGESLYSRADTAVRELIQNAHDAVMRRRQADLTFHGRIDIDQNAETHTLRFSDDGIGLSAEEAERYLGTLGVGVTGMLRRGQFTTAEDVFGGASDDLIGQFGVGLFSAFMLSDRLVVETRRMDAEQGVRWEAGPGTEIDLSSCERTEPGTSVTLHLKSEHHRLAEDQELLETAVKEYADFIPVPIHLNGSSARANVINVAWFDASS